MVPSVKQELERIGYVLPDYRNSNLSAIKGAVERSRKGEKQVFILADGLGYNLIERILRGKESRRLLQGARVRRASSLVPSSTLTVLTSMETGQTPAEHGLVGWNVYAKEHGMILMPYRDAAQISRDFVLSRAHISNVFARPRLLMRAAAKRRLAYLYPEFINKETIGALENCDSIQYTGLPAMLLKIKELVGKGAHGFIYAYYPDLDSVQHIYGPGSEAALRSAMLFLRELNEVLLPRLEGSGYHLTITADHGLTAITRVVEISGKSGIMRYLIAPPWGDSRMMYVNVQHGMEGALREHVRKRYARDAALFDTEELIRSGIFGKKRVAESIKYRFGTHVLLARPHVKLYYEYPYTRPAKRFRMLGSHSGMSAEEMAVPVVSYS